MTKWNNKTTIGFKNFIRNNRLNESKKDDNDIMPDGHIGIIDPQDMIYAIHYLADYLGKYIFAGDIMDFDRIYYEAKNGMRQRKSNQLPSQY